MRVAGSRSAKEVVMASFFFFLFIGLALGFSTGLLRHEDWMGVLADVEMSVIGAIGGGMAFVLMMGLGNVKGAVAVSLLGSLVFLILLKRLIYVDPKPAHR